MSEDTCKKDMGIGILGRPELILARKFRWEAETASLVASFFKNMKVDYINKRLTFDYIDATWGGKGFQGFMWKPDEKEILTFITYSGCGQELYKCIFYNLTILEHTSDFDYEISDVSTQHFLVGYDNCEKTILYKKSAKTTDVAPFDSKFGKVEIEKVELSFLNETVWIPGKVKSASD